MFEYNKYKFDSFHTDVTVDTRRSYQLDVQQNTNDTTLENSLQKKYSR